MRNLLFVMVILILKSFGYVPCGIWNDFFDFFTIHIWAKVCHQFGFEHFGQSNSKLSIFQIFVVSFFDLKLTTSLRWTRTTIICEQFYHHKSWITNRTLEWRNVFVPTRKWCFYCDISMLLLPRRFMFLLFLVLQRKFPILCKDVQWVHIISEIISILKSNSSMECFCCF